MWSSGGRCVGLKFHSLKPSNYPFQVFELYEGVESKPGKTRVLDLYSDLENAGGLAVEGGQIL